MTASSKVLGFTSRWHQLAKAINHVDSGQRRRTRRGRRGRSSSTRLAWAGDLRSATGLVVTLSWVPAVGFDRHLVAVHLKPAPARARDHTALLNISTVRN